MVLPVHFHRVGVGQGQQTVALQSVAEVLEFGGFALAPPLGELLGDDFEQQRVASDGHQQVVEQGGLGGCGRVVFAKKGAGAFEGQGADFAFGQPGGLGAGGDEHGPAGQGFEPTAVGDEVVAVVGIVEHKQFAARRGGHLGEHGLKNDLVARARLETARREKPPEQRAAEEGFAHAARAVHPHDARKLGLKIRAKSGGHAGLADAAHAVDEHEALVAAQPGVYIGQFVGAAVAEKLGLGVGGYVGEFLLPDGGGGG